MVAERGQVKVQKNNNWYQWKCDSPKFEWGERMLLWLSILKLIQVMKVCHPIFMSRMLEWLYVLLWQFSNYYKTLILDIFIWYLRLTLQVTCLFLVFFHSVFNITEILSFVFRATKQTKLQTLFIFKSIQSDFFCRSCIGILLCAKPTFMLTLNIVFCCRIIIVCSCLAIPAHTSNLHKGKL